MWFTIVMWLVTGMALCFFYREKLGPLMVWNYIGIVILAPILALHMLWQIAEDVIRWLSVMLKVRV